VAGVRHARVVGVVLAVAGIVAIAWVVVYLDRLESPLLAPEVLAPESAESVQIDSNEAASGEFLPLGVVLGVNSPAPPPVALGIGPPPEGADAPDLSTPAAAVYSVLSLIDGGRTDEMAACFVDGTDDTGSDLYTSYLGQPVGLVDVEEDGDTAVVTWEATVHKPFARNAKQWPPGKTIALTTRLVQVDGLWKLTQLHNGIEDGSQQDNN